MGPVPSEPTKGIKKVAKTPLEAREPGLESPAMGPKEGPKGKGTKERGPYSLMDHQ